MLNLVRKKFSSLPQISEFSAKRNQFVDKKIQFTAKKIKVSGEKKKKISAKTI